MRIPPRHLMLPVFIALCGWLLASIYAEAQRNAIETATEEIRVHARQAALGIEGFFRYYDGALHYLAELDHVVDLDDEGRFAMAQFLASAETIRAVTRMDERGRILYTVPENRGAFGADISEQAHVEVLLETHQPVVSDVFQAVQGYPTVAFHVPVVDDGTFRGSLAILIPFDLLARKHLDGVGVGLGGHGWLVNADGTQLYGPDPSRRGSNLLDGTGGEGIRALARAMTGGDSGTLAFATGKADAERFLAAFHGIHVGGTTWSVAVTAPEATVLRGTRTLQDKWILVVVLLGLGVSVYTLATFRAQKTLRQADERRRTDRALRSSYQTVLTVLESIDAEVYVADMDTHEILFMNRRMKENFGYDLLGKVCWREFREADSPCAHCTNDRLLDERGDPVGVVAWEGFNPITKRWYLNHDRAIRWVDGRTVRLQVSADITDRKRAEEEALKTEKLESIGVLAGGIAHDFNNLLAGILGNLSLAKMHAGTDGALPPLLEEAEKASIRATSLTQQLLTFAKGGAPVKRVTSVVEIIRDSAEFALRGSGTRLDLTVEPDLMPSEVDPGQLSQAIHNLVLNASQAMTGGGTVHVTARNQPGDQVVIVVRDEGPGIDPEHLPKIFDPYFTTKETGSGLGLATTHSIVRHHGGQLTVSSEPGSGATFTLCLPGTERRTAPRPEGTRTPEPGHGRILVMDDEPMIRKLAGSMLEAVGYEAETVADGAEAVAAYRQAKAAGTPFNAVLLDLTVPGGMGGREALSLLREIDPAVRAIVSSGYAADPILAEYRAHGFAGAIAKPYGLEKLGRVLAAVVESPPLTESAPDSTHA